MDRTDLILTITAGVGGVIGAVAPPVVGKWAFVVAGSAIGAILAIDLTKRLKLVEASDTMFGRLRVHFLMGIIGGGPAADKAVRWWPEPDYDRAGVIMTTSAVVAIFSVTLVCLIWPLVRQWVASSPLLPWNRNKPKAPPGA